MMTTRVSEARRALRFDAGSLALNLAATLGRRGSGGDAVIERLEGDADLAQWCAGVGLAVDPSVDRQVLLGELRDLREQVYEVASRTLAGEAATRATLAQLNHRARHPLPPARFVLDAPVDQTRTIVEQPTMDLPQIASMIVRDLLDLVADDRRRSRLRACEGADCRMLFELPPGARDRRWCSMSRCGNRAKAARHRAHPNPRRDDLKEGNAHD